MSRFQSLWLAVGWAGLSCTLYAVDGVVLIDQNRALAGNVTPGDTAGFPVTISVSGSYRLSGNLTVPDANTTAIQVTADNVSIDLNGFSIIGPVVCSTNSPTTCNQSGTGAGVDGRSVVHNLTVVNGTIRGMGHAGVITYGKSASIEKVHAVGNGVYGLYVGPSSIVRGNTANFNGNAGILTDPSAVITGNTAVGNAGSFAGITVNCPGLVTGNTATGNGGGNITTSGVGCVSATNAAP